MSENRKKKERHSGVMSVVVVGLVAVWLAVTGVIWWVTGDYVESGTIGDSFGAVNALFSALALGGVIYTVVLQTKELGLQRKEMRESRLATQKSAAALEEQAGIQSLGNEIKSLELNVSIVLSRIRYVRAKLEIEDGIIHSTEDAAGKEQQAMRSKAVANREIQNDLLKKLQNRLKNSEQRILAIQQEKFGYSN